MDKLALTRLIRFAINDLSARNGHHGFEELCRFLASARIASNVRPMTGPVAGAGDLGRDFETFATNIRDELGPHGGFAALASDEHIAFACTLQSKGVPTKIRRDLKKIANGNPRAPKVYALVGSDVKAAKAAELKEEALAEYDIELEILDGQALAELLSDYDTFWIAARFLAIPAEYSPDPPAGGAEEPEWYVEARARWRNATRAPQMMGELLDVRDGMRRAVLHAHARPDLGMWLSWISQSASESAGSDHVGRRARYETVFGYVRGIGDLRPADGLAKSFLSETDPATDSWAEILDASVLLQYITTAAFAGRTDLQAQWIEDENRRLRQGVEKRLRKRGLTLTEKTGLLDVLGHLRSHLKIDIELPQEARALPDPLTEDEDSRPKVVPSAAPLLDAEGAIEAWTKFARLAPKAPLVPVDSLSEIVTFLTPALVDKRGFRTLVDLLDEVQAELGGNAAAAERSRDRALALLDAGRPLEALVDLHEAKINWWHGDTLRGSLLALLLLSRTYEELGLPLAARQHALIAVGLAHFHGDDEHGDLISGGLMRVAGLDYTAGAWCAALESYEVAMLAHRVHAEDPFNPERHSDLMGALLHGGYIRAAAKTVSSELEAQVRKHQDNSGLSEILDDNEDDFPIWGPEKWRDHFLKELGSVPFSDAGPDRIIKWSALGIDWEVRAHNRYSHCRAAERFAAAAQILCAELAQEDLVLLPTVIRVRVQASSQRPLHERVRSEPGNDGSRWLVDLVPIAGNDSDPDPEDVTQELTVALAMVLYEASLTSWSQHQRVLERCFKRGLPHKLGAGRPYDDVAGVVTREHFESTNREGVALPREWREVPIRPPVQPLQGAVGPGPGYSKRKSEELIRNRYGRFRELLCETLPALKHDDEFLETYRRLLDRGWKDWHVLMALGNARLNVRIRDVQARRDVEAIKEFLKESQHHPAESPDEPPLPRSWLTEQKLTEFRRMAFFTGATFWDLEIHQETPDVEAIEELLGDRYGYWDDDVDHPPLF